MHGSVRSRELGMGVEPERPGGSGSRRGLFWERVREGFGGMLRTVRAGTVA